VLKLNLCQNSAVTYGSAIFDWSPRSASDRSNPHHPTITHNPNDILSVLVKKRRKGNLSSQSQLCLLHPSLATFGVDPPILYHTYNSRHCLEMSLSLEVSTISASRKRPRNATSTGSNPIMIKRSVSGLEMAEGLNLSYKPH
jgi:hypothetical protein